MENSNGSEKKNLCCWCEDGFIDNKKKDKLTKFGISDDSSSSDEYFLHDLNSLCFLYDVLGKENKDEKVEFPKEVQKIIFVNNYAIIVQWENNYVKLLAYKEAVEAINQKCKKEKELSKLSKDLEEFITSLNNRNCNDRCLDSSIIKKKVEILESEHPILYNGLTTSLKISYSSVDSDDDLSLFSKYEKVKFVNEKVKAIIMENFGEVKNNPDNYIKPLDIVRIFGRRVNAQGDQFPRVHTGVYLGNQKVCHAYVDESGKHVVKVGDWNGFFSPRDEWDKIIRYYPPISFKKTEKIIEHMARCCAEEGKRYFDTFGKLVVLRDKAGANEKVNNCEHFANRCVLGLDYSELADIKRWKKTERIFPTKGFNDLKNEFDENSRKMDGLTNHVPQDEIGKINNICRTQWSQMETKIEVKPILM